MVLFYLVRKSFFHSHAVFCNIGHNRGGNSTDINMKTGKILTCLGISLVFTSLVSNNFSYISQHWFSLWLVLRQPVDCGLSMWGKIIIPMYRLWLSGLYGPRCPLSPKRLINFISLSLLFLDSTKPLPEPVVTVICTLQNKPMKILSK